MSSNKYFTIELKMLKEKKVFPFNLYIYNPASKKYTKFLHANSPFTSKKREFYKFLEERQGKLAISIEQKNTFLKSTALKESEVSDLAPKKLHQLEKARNMYLHILDEKNEKNGVFNFTDEFKNAVNNNDFSKIIAQARDEIITFDVTVSNTNTLAVILAETLLIEENLTNKIISSSYFLAKQCNINDETSLSDLVCAAFFHHIGKTQLSRDILNTPAHELADQNKKDYSKHMGLSLHLIRKSSVKLSDRCQQIIQEHHERADGSGIPFNKKEAHIDLLSLILGSISHIFEYSDGKIIKDKVPIPTIISNLKNKIFTSGLEFEFGDTIYNNLINFTF